MIPSLALFLLQIKDLWVCPDETLIQRGASTGRWFLYASVSPQEKHGLDEMLSGVACSNSEARTLEP